jgi:hypothetical protein
VQLEGLLLRERKSLRDFASDWLETKVPETAPRTQVFYVASNSQADQLSWQTGAGACRRDYKGRYRRVP